MGIYRTGGSDSTHIPYRMTTLTISLWVTSVSLVLVASQRDCITSTSSQQYDEHAELCCPFGIVKRYTVEGREKDCCVNKTFLLETQICCAGSVLSKTAPNGEETSCCGGIQYKLNDSLCCDDKLLEVERGKLSICCGDSKMDAANQECCQNFKGQRKVHEKQPNMKCCQDNYYNKTSQHCFRNRHVLPINQALCGKTLYDVKNNKCCGTTLHARKGELDPIYSCCGDKVFKKTEQKCCGNNLISAQRSCCHRGFYNEKTERCCDKGPVPFTKESEVCCGGGLIDTEDKGCCGNNAYNKLTHQCCLQSGTVIPRSSDMKCCGLFTYNSKKDVCCKYETNFMVIHKLQGHHDKCCSQENSNSAQSFSSSTHFCSMGMIISNDKKMCGAKFLMNEDNDLCCQGKFYQDGKKIGKKCCGVKAKKRCYPKSRNLMTIGENYGICRICRKSSKYFIKYLRSEDVNICRHQALKVIVMDQQPDTSKCQKISLQIKKDLYSNINHKRGKIEVLLPCRCNLSTTKAILLTDTKDFSRTLRLGDSDVLLPWTSKIGRQLKKQRKKCSTLTNNLALANMSEINDFVTYKIEIIKKKNAQQDVNL